MAKERGRWREREQKTWNGALTLTMAEVSPGPSALLSLARLGCTWERRERVGKEREESREGRKEARTG